LDARNIVVHVALSCSRPLPQENLNFEI
jgi:hypothetical protein